MRRGHYIAAISLLVAVFTLSFASSALAAGTPQDICKDLQDNGRLDQTYTAAELTAFLNDPTVQGYCGPIASIVSPTIVTQGKTTPPGQGVIPVINTPLTPPKSGVKGADKTIKTPKKVKGTTHTVSAPKKTTSAGAAPLSATKSSGSLPFTGAELTLFALVGLALIGTGLLLRTTAKERS